jgi:acid phosphatase
VRSGWASATAAVALVLTTVACTPGTGSTRDPAPSAHEPTTFAPISKVLVVVEENHSFDQMRAGMPYLSGLAERYGYATDWRAIAHPSEPNYLAIASGSTYGITDDANPDAHYHDLADATSVFDQARSVGKTARVYAESMPEPCATVGYPAGPPAAQLYVPRHNPWTYFAAGRDGCLADDQALPALAQDAAAGRLPNIGLVIPNLQHDAHNGTLSAADTWLRDHLQPVLDGPDFTTGRLVVVTTADEDDHRSGNRVLTTVLNPRLSGTVAHATLTHYSLTRYIDDVLDVPPLGHAASAPDLTTAFGL